MSLDKLKSLNPVTAVAVCVGVVGIAVLAYLKVSQEVVMGYAMAFIAVAGALEKLVGPKEPTK